MVNKIIYKNERGLSVELNRIGPLFLSSVEGFGGITTDTVLSKTIYQDGTTVKRNILKERILTLNCYMCVDSEYQRSTLKSKLYNIFNPKLKGSMKIFTDAGISRSANNLMVIQSPLFEDDYETDNELVKFQIQLIMPLPFFEDMGENYYVFGDDIPIFSFDLEIPQSGLEMSSKNNSFIVNLRNSGDAEIPLKVIFKAKSNVVNPSIYNVYTKEFIKINKTMEVGEEITINTGIGNKRVESYLNGVTTNIFNLLDINSSFLWLDVGDNIIRYDAEELIEQLEVYIYYTNYYLGV